MSADLEYYKYHLTDEGWDPGDVKEFGKYETRRPERHIYLTITHYSDGSCSGGCQIWNELDYKDTENIARIKELLQVYQPPALLGNIDKLVNNR